MVNGNELARPSRRRRPKASEVVAEEIVNQIVDGDLPEGTRLPSEKEMLELFDVGRSTLRETLRILETRGVITIRSGRNGGPVVRRPRTTDLSEALTLLLQFDRATLVDVLFAREALEPVIAYAASSRITADEIEILREIVKNTGARSDEATFVRENQRFHSTLAEATRNPILQMVSDTLKSITDGGRIGVQYTPEYREAVIAAHLAIVDAVEAGDAELASRSMRTHLVDSERHWSSHHANLHSLAVRWIH